MNGYGFHKTEHTSFMAYFFIVTMATFLCHEPWVYISDSPIILLSICHSCCVWARVLWQVARQRSDGDQLVVAGLGQLVMCVTFILNFRGVGFHSSRPKGEVLALFCTPTPRGWQARRCLEKWITGLATMVAHHSNSLTKGSRVVARRT